jgi:pantothenate kinase
MTAPELPADLPQLSERIAHQLTDGSRFILGITGPPGAGKSTLAAALVDASPLPSALVPMDGYHLDDSVLDALGRRARKGAPDTFDSAGFVHLLRRLRDSGERIVYAPVFDREREQAIAGALEIPASVRVVVVEGNYLLGGDGFSGARELLDECWYVDIDDGLRRERLVARHVAHGRTREAAEAWVRDVDEPNARLIAAERHRADVVVRLDASLDR